MNQLRSRERLIWGALGEEVIKSSRILILGSSILTSELAISLAYSGIGEIVLVDNQVATEEDYGTCLCFEGEKSRIINNQKVNLVKEYLLNLQVDVKVECIFESPKTYFETLMNLPLSSQPVEYSIIVCCNLAGKIVENVYNLAKSCQGITSPFIISLKSKGSLGQYQIFSTNREYLTFDLSTESKNLAKLKGLQLCKPFELLRKLSSEIDLKEFEDQSDNLSGYLSKIPFPILLVHIGLNIGLFNDSKLNMDQQALKKKFKQSMEQILKHQDFPNYIEAKRYIYLIFSDPGELFGDEILQILESQKFLTNNYHHSCLNKKQPFSLINIKYQIVLSWIYKFFNDFGRLPVNKELPEMYCETIAYLQLEKIYNEQFNQDISLISKNNPSSISISNSDYNFSISEEFIKFVCTNLYCLRFIEFRNAFFRWEQIQNKTSEMDSIQIEKLMKALLEDQSQDSQLIEFLFLNFLDYIQVDKKLISSFETIRTEFHKYLKSLKLEYIQVPSDLIQK